MDEAKRREIVAILSVGASRQTAAQYVGCHVDTIRRTAIRDPEFERQLQHAESGNELRHLRNLTAASNDARHWRAATWALERFYPDRYGARRPRTVTAEQVARALAQLANILVQELPNQADRRKILRRLNALAASLGALPNDEEADDE